MNTFILSPQTANLPIQDLLTQAASGSVEILDGDGNVLAYVVTPADREALIYAEARVDLEQHRDEVKKALNRRGGITTQELLDKAKAAQDTSS